MCLSFIDDVCSRMPTGGPLWGSHTAAGGGDWPRRGLGDRSRSGGERWRGRGLEQIPKQNEVPMAHFQRIKFKHLYNTIFFFRCMHSLMKNVCCRDEGVKKNGPNPWADQNINLFPSQIHDAQIIHRSCSLRLLFFFNAGVKFQPCVIITNIQLCTISILLSFFIFSCERHT